MAQDEQQPAPQPAETDPTPPEPRQGRGWRRYLLHAGALVTAIVAALIVTFFSVDIGQFRGLKDRAEREGSKWLDRPMTIGRIRALVRPGSFEFDDVVIQGLSPTDRPFMRIRKITVSIPWWTIFNRELIIESVALSDWEMYVESFPGGRHNFPRVMGPPRDPNRPRGPKRFDTTLRWVEAAGGNVTYVDHGTPWRVVAPNMRITLFRRPERNDYGGTAAFAGGRVRIQSYEEFGATMNSTFSMVPPNLHFDRIDLKTDGAESVLVGDLQMNRWPEQTYQIRSIIDMATQKDI
jgi:hypothetical protein